MTQLYFVRHAQPQYSNHDDAERELSPKGMEDRKLVTNFLMDKGIDAVLSSPYTRAVETVRHFADTVRMPIIHMQEFRERTIAEKWIDDFDTFCRSQWADFDYRLDGGECLREVQQRNIAAPEGNSGRASGAEHRHRHPRHGSQQHSELLPSLVRL